MQMTDPATLLSAAANIGDRFEALLAEARVHDSGEARIAACLCLTIAELHIAVIAVLRSRAQSHAPILVRSMHEALADLKNLVEDSTYLNQMRFDNADQALKTFKGFKDDPDMQDEQGAQNTLLEWIAKEQGIFDELQKNGFKQLLAAGKFKKAGMVGEYATGYRFLCSYSHSDLNTLIARHAGDRHLRFTDTLSHATLKSVLGMALTVYARAVETLPQYTNLSTEMVKAAIDSADNIWPPADST